nr:carbonyl reductase [NADPH] 3-like [Vanessa tameamea]
MTDKIAVVTGSNKGIGYGTVKELCKRGVGVVYLTSRDTQRGLQAAAALKQEGFHPEFHQLDVSDVLSVKKFADFLKRKHGGIDILINNAALVPEDFNRIVYSEVKRVIEINYKSYFNIQDYLFPILKYNARVVNISSDCDHVSKLKNVYWIKRLTKNDVQIQDIDSFVNWFLTSVKNGSLNEKDFASTCLIPYVVSNIAVCSLTKIQQREIDRNISINSLHPGFVKTDMTKHAGEFTVEEASQTSVYLALDCDQSIKGKYIWFDKTEKDWTDLNVT